MLFLPMRMILPLVLLIMPVVLLVGCHGATTVSDSRLASDLPPSRRPQSKDRSFNSASVEDVIASLKPQFKDQRIAVLFENCWPYALDYLIVPPASGSDAFVITGLDIKAMWLRDSTAQMLPYMWLASADHELQMLLRGVVMRQLRSVLINPYANAFNQGPDGHPDPGWQTDECKPPVMLSVHEVKWELDSLAAVMQFHAAYFRITQDASVLGMEWKDAMHVILQTLSDQQHSTEEQHGAPPYTIDRNTGQSPKVGCPRHCPFRYPEASAARTNMVRSGFRPSDDSTRFDFLVPANLMVSAALEDAAELAAAANLSDIAIPAARLAAQIKAAVAANGTTSDGRYIYEVDGLGGVNDMDDANAPSLLSLPHSTQGKISRQDATYRRTRDWVLSARNPWYFAGEAASGIGSPHTGPDSVWPLSIIMQALTSEDDNEISRCLELLVSTSKGTGFMAEAFNKDDSSKGVTRPAFGWANALFGQLILTLVNERPHLVIQEFFD